jgi:hypothetical protein
MGGRRPFILPGRAHRARGMEGGRARLPPIPPFPHTGGRGRAVTLPPLSAPPGGGGSEVRGHAERDHHPRSLSRLCVTRY